MSRDIYGFNADYVAAFAVVLMIAYGVIAYHIPEVQMRIDRLGDNFYYLGFIYTLASLSAALLQLRAGIDINELLGSFGIALVTTIVGIAGRVMFVQLRSELDDIEERVRRDLAAASSDLRAQLSASVREFETFRTGLLQTLKETGEAFAENKKKQTEQIDGQAQAATQQLLSTSAELHTQLTATLREFEVFRATLTKANKKQTELIETLVDKSTARIDAAFDACDMQSRRAAELVNTIAEVAESAAKRFAETDLPGERLSAQLEMFARRLEGVLVSLQPVSTPATDDRPNARRGWHWSFRQ